MASSNRKCCLRRRGQNSSSVAGLDLSLHRARQSADVGLKFLDVVETGERRLVLFVNPGIAALPDDNKAGVAEWHRVWVQRRIVDIVRARSENRARWIGGFHLVKFQRRPAGEKQRHRRIGRPRLAFSPGGAEHSLKLDGVQITVLNEFRTV